MSVSLSNHVFVSPAVRHVAGPDRVVCATTKWSSGFGAVLPVDYCFSARKILGSTYSIAATFHSMTASPVRACHPPTLFGMRLASCCARCGRLFSLLRTCYVLCCCIVVQRKDQFVYEVRFIGAQSLHSLASLDRTACNMEKRKTRGSIRL